MNRENFEDLLSIYEKKQDFLNGGDHYELFKWVAVKHFQDTWFAENAESMTFAELFAEATRKTGIMINNSRITPTNGIVKLAEKRPEEVEHLFRNVLYADDSGDLDVRNDHINTFLSEIERLRQEEFPRFWKYKQDRHTAICYLALYDPQHNFIYRHKDVSLFCKYIEMGLDIGSGQYFSLKKYYQMCETIVKELKAHPSLIEKHDSFMSDKLYSDEELHLLAFDIMYCGQCYNFYKGMQFIPKKVASASRTQDEKTESDTKAREEKITALQMELEALEDQIGEYEDISLLDVSVFHKKYGEGIIITQDRNVITVQFHEKTVTFHIHKQFPARPSFENDEEIVEMLSAYADTRERRDKIKAELQRMKSL